MAAVDDTALKAQLRALDNGFLFAAGVAVLLAGLLGVLLAVSFSRPLRVLEDAAARVGAGDLESTIGVGMGGEVGRALSAFNQMTHELKRTRERLLRAERIAAWREIARRIAHEIKNPLSPIQVSIETMRKTYAKRHPDFDEIFEESTLTILEEVGRLKRIVSEFSQFARMPRPKAAELNVREVLEHVLSLHRDAKVALALDHDPSAPAIRADREQLTQVFMNLLQNAVDAATGRHGDHGGRVTLSVGPAEGRGGVIVSVCDNGPGIRAEERDRIFEPYYTTKATGTGLGLPIAHRIIEDHGGAIEVLDGSDGGAELRIFLPSAGPPSSPDESESETTLSRL
jgi:nitrogen fixation/metabolism regulation signal transduction histidine kinase